MSDLTKQDKGPGLFSFIFHGILIAGILGAIFWFQFGGIIHSYQKHSIKDLILAVALPPFAWFRSIEFFWHKDESQ